MQQAARVAKNTGFLYARMAITVFISLYSTRLVLNALGATDFGIFNVVAGAIAMLTFLNVAMTGATQRFMSYAEGKQDFQAQLGIFNVSILLHLIIGIVIVIILELVGIYLFKGILEIPDERLYAAKLIFHCMVASTFFKIISVPYDAVINAHENMFLVAVLGVLEAFLKLIVAIYVSLTDFDGLISYGLLMALLAIVILIIKRIYCHWKYDEVVISLKKYCELKVFKEMGSFAGWSFLGSSTTVLSNYGQGIVLNMFFGPVVNASQGIANQVSGQLGSFSTTMMTALNPAITKNEGAGNRELMLKASLMGSKISFLLFSFFAIPAIVEMDFVLKSWLVDVPEFAVVFCILLLYKNLIEQFFLPLTSSINAVGNIKNFRIYTSILNFFPLIASFSLFKLAYPPYYLYYVFIMTALISGFLSIWFAQKNCGLNVDVFFKKVIIRCVLVFFGTLLISQFPKLYMESGIIRLVLVGVTSCTFFLLLAWIVGFDEEEKIIARGLFGNIILKLKWKK